MKKTAYNRGYVGLISLLIAVAIIGFMFVKIYASSNGEKIPALAPNSEGLTPVQQAEEAKRMLEKNNVPISNQINILPKTILPGDPVLVTIDSEIKPVAILWDNKSIPIFIYEGKTRAFSAVDFNEKNLNHIVTVKLADGKTLIKNVKITPREKIEKPLGIPDKLGGNTPEAVTSLVKNLAADNFVLNSVKTATTTFWAKAFKYPLDSIFITDNYGYDRNTVNQTIPHKGTDFRAKIGTRVMAMNRGVVRIARLFISYGNTVVIDHGQGVQTLYMHMSKLNVKEGDVVEQGDVLGLSGDTGYVDAAHLHISVKINGISIDPITFLQFFVK